MTDRNKNRPGYKKTQAGWIPVEWDSSKIRYLSKLTAGGTPSTKHAEYWGGPIPWMSSGELNLKRVYGVAGRITELGLKNSSTKLIPKHSVLVGLAGQGKTRGTAAINEISLCTNQSVAAIIPNEKLHYLYVYYNLDNRYLELRRLSTGDGGRGGLNLDLLSNLIIPIPHLPEQKKIAEILSIWDEGIEQTRQLITAAKRRKKALMQKLLTGKKRLPGFKSAWPTKKLFSITERIITSPASTDGYPVLSITAGTGFVSQEDKFSKVIAGRHIEHYVLLRKGEFSYNKGNSYRYPQGCAYRLQEYDIGLVPDVFYSFRLKPGINPEFVEQFFHAGLHGTQLRRWINTGVRNNGLLNLNASDFFNLQIPFPEIKEQRAIAAVLRTADEEIAALEIKLAALEKQKKGLMQKLLTGRIRAKTEMEAVHG